MDATEEPVEERVALSTEAENNPEVEPEDGVQEGGRITVQDPDVDGQEDTAQLDEAQVGGASRRQMLARQGRNGAGSNVKCVGALRCHPYTPPGTRICPLMCTLSSHACGRRRSRGVKNVRCGLFCKLG